MKCGRTERYASGDCCTCARRRSIEYQASHDRKAYKLAWAKRKRGFVKLSPEEYQKRQLEAGRKWRENNVAAARAASAKWKKENREAVRAQIQTRKSRLLGSAGSHNGKDRQLRSAMFGDMCWICEKAPKQAMDHVYAVSNGGANWASNLRPICNCCNGRKGRWEQGGKKSLSEILNWKIKAKDFGLKRTKTAAVPTTA